jgi:hypothetical protein
MNELTFYRWKEMERECSRKRILAVVDVKENLKNTCYRQCKQLAYKNISSLDVDILKQKKLGKTKNNSKQRKKSLPRIIWGNNFETETTESIVNNGELKFILEHSLSLPPPTDSQSITFMQIFFRLKHVYLHRTNW